MKKLLLLLLFAITLSQDTDPPYYYYSNDIEGPSVQFDIQETLNYSNGTPQGLWLSLEGLLGCCAIIDDDSGIYSAGYRFISPSGEINEIFLRGEQEFIDSWGSWSDYISWGIVDISYSPGDIGGIFMVQVELEIPDLILENGLYQVEFIATDNVGNELVIAGEELSGLTSNGTSTIDVFGISQTFDINPPYYVTHPDYGPSIIINNPSEVIKENSVFNFILSWGLGDIQDYEFFENLNIQESALYDDESGINKVGFKFISPSGIENDVYLKGDDAHVNVWTFGSWANYLSQPWITCSSDDCHDGYYNLIIPSNELEFGTYEIHFIAIDFSGNELVISGEELEELNVNGVSTITFVDGDSNDTEPPYYYYSDDIQGPSLELSFSDTMNFDNSSSVFDFNIGGMLGCCAIIDDNSGINSAGARFISPNGEINDVMIGGYHPQNIISGTWSEYASSVIGEIDESAVHNLIFQLIIPYTAIEFGTYQIELVALDNAGNELVITGEELATLNSNNNSNVVFETTQNFSTINPFDDYNILTWDWGIGDNIIIQESSFNLFSEGDTLYAIDENALISSDCNDSEPYGPAILDKHVIMGYMDEFSLYCNGSIEDCEEYDLSFPGFLEGNPMKFKYFDYSDGEYYDIIPEYSSGNGLFGVPFDDTLTFKYFDASLGLIYDLEYTHIFSPDMIVGSFQNPVMMNIDYSSSVNEIPNWDFNLNYFQYNGSISTSVIGADYGDKFFAFVGEDCRGIAEPMDSPFGGLVFPLMTYANPEITRISSFEVIIDRNNRDLDDYANLQTESNYKYNIYKNNILLESSYEQKFIIDSELDDGENCYEIYLIDNYDDSEFLSTDEFCMFYESNAENCFVLGDSSGDGLFNVLDIVEMVSHILGNSTIEGISLTCSDINQDGTLNVLDVVAGVGLILGT